MGLGLGYSAEALRSTVLRGCFRFAFGTLAVAAALTVAEPHARAATPEAQAEAQVHFTKAKELYQSGGYQAALAELQTARALDPEAKDLVFNLGVVCEKLGRFDEAIGHFRTFIDMGPVALEKQRAESFIKRIEGAKKELAAQQAAQDQKQDGKTPPKEPAPAPTPPSRGHWDTLTTVTAGLAIASTGVGITFGALALSNRPGSDFTTGRDGSYNDLQSRVDTAHTQAVVADIAFVAGAALAITTGILYFARSKPASTSAASTNGLPMAPVVRW
jgi:tetratricopeptide (TPR) repeat protein